ncbi:MAG: hypothetical protein GXX92_08980 [Clostridiales bacterium]|nr:hypothetical protein [Clostridiales bacterium]
MSTVVGIIMYVLLAPLLAGLLVGLGAFISAHLQGENPPHILESFRKLLGLFREPWTEADSRQKLLCILRVALILTGGSILFAGGNLALSILLLLFTEFIKIYNPYSIESKSLEQNHEPMELERDLAAFGTFSCQMLLTAAGLYCFTAYISDRGSFLAADLISAGTAPALYLPAMLVGLIALLLFGRNTGFAVGKEKSSFSGKEQAFLEIGNWYRVIALYAVLFLFNYGGTVFSAVVSVGICLLVWFLALLLQKPHSRQPKSVSIAAVSTILMIASFVNLLILLP